MPFGGPGSNDFKIDHDLIQIYAEIGAHVYIDVQKLRRKLLTPKTGEIESELCEQSAIKSPDEFYPVATRLEKIVMPQNNKTRGREVRKLTCKVSTARSKMKN